MASALPPVKDAAFTFFISLVSQADADVFKASPTLAAGDITVSKDGGNFANITTLPTQIQSTGVLPVGLSATEMNADLIVVLFHDAAGDEWQDALVTIYTAAQTLDVTDGIADNVKSTVNHADYGNAKLVRSQTPANALDVSPAGGVVLAAGSLNVDVWDNTTAFPLMAADSGATQVARVGADGDTLETLSDQIAGISSGSGSGTGTYTDTITDGVNPLDGVRVQLSTDVGGSNRVYEAFTNASGVFSVNPDPGTYYRWLDLAGYTFAQGVQVVVP